MSTRILRRVPRTEERIKLGPKATPMPSAVPAEKPADRSAQDRASEQQAREIDELQAKLAQSQKQCEQLGASLARVETELASSRELAKQQGHQEGLQQAQAHAERELEQSVAAWRRTVEQTLREAEARLQAIRTELADVVMASVVKLIGDHLLNPQSVRAMVEQTLKEAGIAAPTRILLAPQQYEQLTRFGASHVSALRERRIEIAPDPRIAHGGCMIEAANGLVDARFEVQLAGLKDILAGHYAPQHAGAAK